jgi:hypothetical protein
MISGSVDLDVANVAGAVPRSRPSTVSSAGVRSLSGMSSMSDPRAPSGAGNLFPPTNALLAAHKAQALAPRQRMIRNVLDAHRPLDAHPQAGSEGSAPGRSRGAVQDQRMVDAQAISKRVRPYDAQALAKALGPFEQNKGARPFDAQALAKAPRPVSATQTPALQNVLAALWKSGAADLAKFNATQTPALQNALRAANAMNATAARVPNVGAANALQNLLRTTREASAAMPKVDATPVAPSERPRRRPRAAAAPTLPLYTREEIERRRRADEALVAMPGGIEGVQAALEVVCALLEEMSARARAAEDREQAAEAREQAAEARAVAGEAREARGERREVAMLRMTVLAVVLAAVAALPVLAVAVSWLVDNVGRVL